MYDHNLYIAEDAMKNVQVPPTVFCAQISVPASPETWPDNPSLFLARSVVRKRLVIHCRDTILGVFSTTEYSV